MKTVNTQIDGQSSQVQPRIILLYNPELSYCKQKNLPYDRCICCLFLMLFFSFLLSFFLGKFPSNELFHWIDHIKLDCTSQNLFWLSLCNLKVCTKLTMCCGSFICPLFSKLTLPSDSAWIEPPPVNNTWTSLNFESSFRMLVGPTTTELLNVKVEVSTKTFLITSRFLGKCWK